MWVNTQQGSQGRMVVLALAIQQVVVLQRLVWGFGVPQPTAWPHGVRSTQPVVRPRQPLLALTSIVALLRVETVG